jgi:hypothetical protein
MPWCILMCQVTQNDTFSIPYPKKTVNANLPLVPKSSQKVKFIEKDKFNYLINTLSLSLK